SPRPPSPAPRRARARTPRRAPRPASRRPASRRTPPSGRPPAPRAAWTRPPTRPTFRPWIAAHSWCSPAPPPRNSPDRPRPRPRSRPRPRPPGSLRFELDERRRWSLWYESEDERVALVELAEVVAWVGDQPVTLAQLEDSTVANRRPPGGEAVVVHGRTAGIWMEVEFLARGDAPAPQATITVTLFPDTYLPSVRGV